jgi:glycosyltransferase involved in cell wall biosynthesis
MKILFCDNRLGGLLGFRVDIIKHFIEAGHDVCLVVPPALTDWDNVGVHNIHVRIITIDMQPSGQNPFNDFKLLIQYLKIFRQERPNIVFNYTIKPNIYSTMAARIMGCRVVCMLAGLGYMFDKKGFLKHIGLKLYKFGLKGAERVLVLNEMNYEKLCQTRMVPKEKLILLSGGEGVNLQEYPYSVPDYSKGVTFLMVSRLLYDKGYSEFVEAARIVKAQYPSIQFELLGPTAYDSPMGVKTEEFKKDCQEGIFTYLGVSNNVYDIVSRQNVVMVLPSKYGEGLNRSLLEACAIGRPIITTDIPGCREVVRPGKNGYLVPANNSNTLADAMIAFINLPASEKTKMGEYSHNYAKERFDVRKVIEIYDRVVG